MDGTAGDPGTRGWWMRVDALTFVRIAFNFSKIEAEKFLLNYLCAASPTAWRSERRFNVKVLRDGEERTMGGRLYRFDASRRRLIEIGKEALASPAPPWEEKRTPLPLLLEELKADIQKAFWWLVKEGIGRAEDNSAFYAGLMFRSLVDSKIQVGTKIELRGHSGVVTLTGKLWVEIELSVIQIAAAPLIAAVRAKDGFVDAAIEKLRSLGRLLPVVAAATDLPSAVPTTVDPGSEPEAVLRRGEAKRQVAKVLTKISSKDYTQARYVDEVLVNRISSVKRKTLINYLYELVRDEPQLWQGTRSQLGETPPDPRSARAAKSASKPESARR